MLEDIKEDLRRLGNPEKAKTLSRFFKTGKGEYGEGDVFLGIIVPEQRKIANKYRDLSLKELGKLISSKIHEHRLTALFILIGKYKKASEEGKKEIYDFYLKNTGYINNWDLVDSSAQYIVGDFTLEGDRSVLYELARSENLWERRIEKVL
jgi:3-methyladenine DNA glycosylase AlkD